MTSQQETPPVIVSSVILASPNDWDEWIEVIKSKANNNRLWKYVDPSTPETDLPQHEEPVRASPKDANSRGKTKLAELAVMSMVRLLFGLVRFNQNLESNRFVDFIGSIWIGY